MGPDLADCQDLIILLKQIEEKVSKCVFGKERSLVVDKLPVPIPVSAFSFPCSFVPTNSVDQEPLGRQG